MPKRPDQPRRNQRERDKYATSPAYRRRALERARRRREEQKEASATLAQLDAMPPRLLELLRLLKEVQ